MTIASVISLSHRDGLEQNLDRISACDDKDELHALIAALSMNVVSDVMLLAACVKRLTTLDPSCEIDLPILPYLRKVADGSVAPELVARVMGGRLLAKASALPLADQRKVASDDPVKVMQSDGDHRMIKPSQLSDQQVLQIFSGIRMRNEAEQITWLKERDERRRIKAAAKPAAEITYTKHSAIVGGVELSTAMLAQMLAKLTK